MTEWRAVPGGIRADGSVVTMPPELQRAQFFDTLCSRYGSFPWPGTLLEQPAIPFLRWQRVLAEASPEASQGTYGGGADPLADIPMTAL